MHLFNRSIQVQRLPPLPALLRERGLDRLQGDRPAQPKAAQPVPEHQLLCPGEQELQEWPQ